MDDEKVQAYADLAAQMMELHASIALLAQNVEKMARTDEQVTSMTRIFNGVYVGIEERLSGGADSTAVASVDGVSLAAGSRMRRSRPTIESRRCE
jgi:hypothetical protein